MNRILTGLDDLGEDAVLDEPPLELSLRSCVLLPLDAAAALPFADGFSPANALATASFEFEPVNYNFER